MLCVYWVGVPERGEKPIRNFHRKWIPIRWRPTLPAAPGNLHTPQKKIESEKSLQESERIIKNYPPISPSIPPP